MVRKEETDKPRKLNKQGKVAWEIEECEKRLSAEN